MAAKGTSITIGVGIPSVVQVRVVVRQYTLQWAVLKTGAGVSFLPAWGGRAGGCLSTRFGNSNARTSHSRGKLNIYTGYPEFYFII